MKFRRIASYYFLLASALLGVAGCADIHEPFRPNDLPPPSVERPAAPQLAQFPFGNPSNAVADPGNEQNFLIIGDVSVISYNNQRGTANWVAWKTTREDLGRSLPRPDFRPDPRLPKWFNRIGYYDYAGSGYDRGHMVPSADRFSDPVRNEATFMMSNIVPQAGGLNQYPWNEFEMYVRAEVRKGLDAYQIAGVYGDAGRLKNKVTVPSNCWKIVVLKRRGEAAGDIGPRTRIIAVDMPNIGEIEKDRWTKFRTTVRSIEEKTGYDIFAHLPRELQNAIETSTEIVNR